MFSSMANKPRYIKINDETRTLTEWIAEYADVGITRQLVLGRIAKGMPIEKALTKPPRRYRDNHKRITRK